MDNNKKTGIRKIRMGTIVGAKMNKTVVVSVERLVKHPIYGKYVKKRVKYMVHDGKGECKDGDRVKIIETTPISKMKRWRIGQVLERV